MTLSSRLTTKITNSLKKEFPHREELIANTTYGYGAMDISALEYRSGILKINKAINQYNYSNSSRKNHFLSLCYHQLGIAYQGLGDYPLALTSYNKALNLKSKNSTLKSKAISYLKLANIYNEMGYYSKSIEFSKKILELNTNFLFIDVVYYNMADSYFKQQKYNDSLKYAQLAYKTSLINFGKENSYLLANTVLLSQVYAKLNNSTQSIQFLEKSLLLSAKIEKSNFTVTSYIKDIAKTYDNLHQFNKAYTLIDRSFSQFSIAKIDYFSQLNQFHKKTFIQRNNQFISALLDISFHSKQEKSKTFDRWLNYKRAIFDIGNSFKSLLLKSKDNKIKKQIKRLFYLERKLAQLYQMNTKEINSKIVEYNKEISELEISLSRYIPSMDNVSYKDISKYLDDNKLYIDFAKIEENYYLFTLDKSKNITFQKLDAEAIDKTIKSIQTENQNIIDGTTFANIKKAKKQYGELYDLIFSQIDIDNQKSLIISPDGLLSLIPFEAFYDKKEKKYLIEKVKINYIPSGKELVNLYKKEEVSNSKVVVFANPDFGVNRSKEIDKFRRGTVEALYAQAKDKNSVNQLFKPLNGTEKEALAIKKLYPHSQIYSNKEASEANFFKISQPKILHLSTHGFFLKDEKVINPMLKSGIALSGANYAIKNQNGEGIVTALEISGLNLKGTELVVLSACETGVGEVEEAEGIAGINKAFMKAGARYIVMSLWSVNDNATAILMKNFYGNIKNNKGYTTALRDAKIEMIKNGKAHPYYWGGFVGSGISN